MPDFDHVNKKLDLAAIATRTGLPVRRLRYVVDHSLVPGLTILKGGRGNARSTSLFDAVVLTTAAALLDAGISRTRVRFLMERHGGARASTSTHSLWYRFRHGGELVYSCNPFVVLSVKLGAIANVLK